MGYNVRCKHRGRKEPLAFFFGYSTLHLCPPFFDRPNHGDTTTQQARTLIYNNKILQFQFFFRCTPAILGRPVVFAKAQIITRNPFLLFHTPAKKKNEALRVFLFSPAGRITYHESVFILSQPPCRSSATGRVLCLEKQYRAALRLCPASLAMSVLPPEVHAELAQLLQALQSADNNVRSQAEEHLQSNWTSTRPEVLLMGLAEQISISNDTPVHRPPPLPRRWMLSF